MKLLLVFKAAKNSEYSFMLDFKLQAAGQTIEGQLLMLALPGTLKYLYGLNLMCSPCQLPDTDDLALQML